MHRTRSATALICGLMLLALPSPGRAQEYSFAVSTLQLFVEPQSDASATLQYTMIFANNPGAHVIDVIDVGLPNDNYNIGNMSATIDGRYITDIRKSTVIRTGVEVHLDPYGIPAGSSGVFKFRCTMPDLVYQDTTRQDFASLRITPTWFNGQYVTGSTKLQIAILLPQGVKGDDVLYQTVPFTKKALDNGRVIAYWEMPQVRLDGPHMVGVSFRKPAGLTVIQITKFQLLEKWFEQSQTAQLCSGVLLALIFTTMFFRATGGTGCSCWLPILVAATFYCIANPVAQFLYWICLIPISALAEWQLRKTKRTYLPAMVSVEGGGIKRGLTAPQAAVLLGMPLNKVLTLIVFGMLKKGLVRVVKDNPFTVELVPDFAGDKTARARKAAEKGVVIHAYEDTLADLLLVTPPPPLANLNVNDLMKNLVTDVVARMKGFDVAQTKEYYQHIVSRAWTEAKAAGEVENRTQSINRNLEWLLMDPDYNGQFGELGRRGYMYDPIWWHTYSGGWSVPSAGPAPAMPSAGGQTSFGDVANSFAGWAENAANGLAVKLDPVSLGGHAAPMLDLSGVDKMTGDIFQALAESSSSGGGGGGCACAGCACACACAGGGR